MPNELLSIYLNCATVTSRSHTTEQLQLLPLLSVIQLMRRACDMHREMTSIGDANDFYNFDFVPMMRKNNAISDYVHRPHSDNAFVEGSSLYLAFSFCHSVLLLDCLPANYSFVNRSHAVL